MSAPTTVLPLPDVPPDVRTFAEEEGLAAYLPAVLAMTRRIFQSWRITVFLEEDLEITGDWYITLEVQVPDDAIPEKLAEMDWQWHGEISQHCPSTHVRIFHLGMA